MRTAVRKENSPLLASVVDVVGNVLIEPFYVSCPAFLAWIELGNFPMSVHLLASVVTGLLSASSSYIRIKVTQVQSTK